VIPPRVRGSKWTLLPRKSYRTTIIFRPPKPRTRRVYSKMFRAKTVKRNSRKTAPVVASVPAADLSGNVLPVPEPVKPMTNAMNTETMLTALLDAESKSAVHRPWLRLERGLRMRLLRAYVEKQKELSVSERVDLLNALVDALDKKLLNSKSQITYNSDIGEIVEINSLKIIRPSEGKITFRIEPPNRGTKKARRTGSSDSD